MDEEQIISYLLQRDLNCKVNNNIFADLNKSSKNNILKSVKNKKMIITNYRDLDDYYIPQSNELKIVLIDLSVISILEILNYTLSYLGIQIEEDLDLSDKKALFKFQSYLKKNNIGVELVLYNQSIEDKDTQKYICNLFKFNSYLFNISILLESGNDLKTYQTSTGETLDNREDYSLINLRRY